MEALAGVLHEEMVEELKLFFKSPICRRGLETLSETYLPYLANLERRQLSKLNTWLLIFLENKKTPDVEVGKNIRTNIINSSKKLHKVGRPFRMIPCRVGIFKHFYLSQSNSWIQFCYVIGIAE